MTQRSNGKMSLIWEVATKFFLATYPFAVSWAIWVSAHIWKAPTTYVEQKEFRATVEKLDSRLDEMPPAEWKERIDKMDIKIDKMFDEIVSLRVLLASQGSRDQSFNE